MSETETDINCNAQSKTSLEAQHIQQPGEVIRPVVSDSCVKELVKKAFGLTLTSMTELNSYDDKNFHIFVESDHVNPYISEVSSHGYFFKILNSMDSARPQFLEAQNDFMNYLQPWGISTQRPLPDIHGKYITEECVYSTDDKTEYKRYLVMLRTFIPGRIIYQVPYRPALLYRNGLFLGKMTKVLEEFYNSFLETHDTTSIWSLKNVPHLRNFTFAVTDPTDRDMVEKIIQAYEDEVVPLYGKFSKGYIHGDFNEQNILVSEMAGQEGIPDEKKEYSICGVLDYADLALSYRVFDLALNIAYLSIDSKIIDQLEVGGHILAGYRQYNLLNASEYNSLHLCVMARLTQSLVLGAYSYHQDPKNTYVLTTSGRGWPLLRKFWSIPPSELYTLWEKIQEGYKARF